MSRDVLEVITAVVVGAILDLTLFLGKTAIFPSGLVSLKQLNAISLGGVILFATSAPGVQTEDR
jgi:hypothetical protein